MVRYIFGGSSLSQRAAPVYNLPTPLPFLHLLANHHHQPPSPPTPITVISSVAMYQAQDDEFAAMYALLRDDDGYQINDILELAPSSSGGDEEDPHPNRGPAKRKRHHRHTDVQIQELEDLYKRCPHPDDNQRKELGERLSLHPLQIKFWFQNKRTQVKAQKQRNENFHLEAENDKLRAENIKYRQELANITCLTCGGGAAPTVDATSSEVQRLRIENDRLRKEIDMVSGISKTPIPYPQGVQHSLNSGNVGAQSGLVGETYVTGDLVGLLPGPTEADKPLIIELAVAAMEELKGMAQTGIPLWIPSTDNISTDTLNEDHYSSIFPPGIGKRPLGKKSEATRESAVVVMSHINLIQILMDVDQWMSVFPDIVSTAKTLEVISAGVAGKYDGALQVMKAEFQVPSPIVPTREHYFVRYCKQHLDGTWAVVDVSLDNLRPNTIVGSCRRRPSGCLIQELPNGYSKVIWVEHVEVDAKDVHSIYGPLVDSGLGFGAKRWVATLERQCERRASALSCNITAGLFGLITTSQGRKSMFKLSERMMMGFCTGVSASATHKWTKISDGCDSNVRIMTKKSVDEPGKPSGILLSAATSLWLPVPPAALFGFLRDKNSRNQWDILSNGGVVQEMVRIPSGRDPGNAVSLLSVNSSDSRQSNMLILEESMTDATCSYVIYAPVDKFSMNVILSGGNPDNVALLPSGFAILPDGISDVGSGGSLLTGAFQVLVDSIPTAKLSPASVEMVNSLIKGTIEKIRSCVRNKN